MKRTFVATLPRRHPARLSSLVVSLALVLASLTPANAEKPRAISFMGDSTTGALYSPPGFPKLVGDLLRVSVHNLTVKYPPSYTTKEALLEELPLLPADTTDAVLFLGVDDLRLLGNGEKTLEETLDANAAIAASLRTRGIRIYEVLIRDYTKERIWQPQPYDLAALPNMGKFVGKLNDAYRTTPDVTIIDAPSWADVYEGTWTRDGIHFNAAALERFARHMAQALR